MPIIYWVSTACLVVWLGLVVAALARGRRISLAAGLLYAVVCIPVGWQAATWLQAGHPEASQVRHAAVWVQAISCFGVALLSVVGVLISRRNADVAMHQLR